MFYKVSFKVQMFNSRITSGEQRLQVGFYLLFYNLLASLPLLVGFFIFIIMII